MEHVGETAPLEGEKFPHAVTGRLAGCPYDMEVAAVCLVAVRAQDHSEEEAGGVTECRK